MGANGLFIFILSLCLHGTSSYGSCTAKTEEVIVNGNSMSPLLTNKQVVKLDLNYYSCHEIKKGDVIVFAIPGRNHRIIKKVFAVPTDKFTYKNKKIMVNGTTAKNSKNIEYVIDSKMLKLFSESYPVVPQDSYLVLGDLPSGSFDASQMGFIDRKQIVGRVLIDEDGR